LSAPPPKWPSLSKQYDRQCVGGILCREKPTRFWLSPTCGYLALCPEHAEAWPRLMPSRTWAGFVEMTLQELRIAEVQNS
jgi:hypothetical protein